MVEIESLWSKLSSLCFKAPILGSQAPISQAPPSRLSTASFWSLGPRYGRFWRSEKSLFETPEVRNGYENLAPLEEISGPKSITATAVTKRALYSSISLDLADSGDLGSQSSILEI